MPFKLSNIPGFADLANINFVADSYAIGLNFQRIIENAKFGTVRPEVFVGKYLDGNTVLLPTSAVDGYTYTRDELTYFWHHALTGGSSPANNGAPTAPGAVRYIGANVDQITGLVSSTVEYLVANGSAPTVTKDGTLLVFTIATRQLKSLTMASTPTYADISDSEIAEDQAVQQSFMQRLNTNAKLASVTTEIIYMGQYVHGDTVPQPLSPVDGYTYSYADTVFQATWRWTPPGGAFIDPVDPNHKQIRDLVWDINGITGAVSTQVMYYNNTNWPTNDGRLDVWAFCTRPWGSLGTPAPDFTDLSLDFLAAGNAVRYDIMQALKDNVLFALCRPEFFVGLYTNGQVVSLPTSTKDGYVYSRSELFYLYSYKDTGSPSSDIRIGSWHATIDQGTGVVTSQISRVHDGGGWVDTYDGHLQVVTIAMRGHVAISSGSFVYQGATTNTSGFVQDAIPVTQGQITTLTTAAAAAQSTADTAATDAAAAAAAAAAKVPGSRLISTTAPLTGGGNLTADRTLGINVMGASGSGHAIGAVPDPGPTAGTTRYLREDGTWNSPSAATTTLGSPSYVQSIVAHSTGTSISATLGSATAEHSAIVVVLFAGAFTTSISSVTDNMGNTYNLVKALYPSTTYCGQYLYVALNALAGATTVTANYTQANNQMNIMVAEYSSVATVAAVDGLASNEFHTGGGSTFTVGPISTSTDHEVLVATYAIYSVSATVAPSSPFVLRSSLSGISDTNLQGFLADQFAATAGSYSATWTGTNWASTQWDGILISLKASSTTTGGTGGTGGGTGGTGTTTSVAAQWPLVAFTDPTTQPWIWVNQGSATLSSAAGAGGNNYLSIYESGSGARNSRLFVKAVPSAPYTITACLVPLHPFQGAGTQVGMVLRESSSEKTIGWTLIENNSGTNYAPYFGLYKQNSPFSFNSTYQEGYHYYSTGQPIWLRIKDDGTTRYFQWSFDGIQFITFYSVGRTDYITPDQIGVYVDSNSSGKPVALTLLSWKEGA